MAVDFSTLPDSMESEELYDYFKQFLDEYGDHPGELYEIKQLYELAYRQWDTYERISSDIAESLNNYVISSIDLTSYEVMDVLISVVENLSLSEAFHYLIDHKDEAFIPAVRDLIDEAEDEYSDIIDDPFDLY